jgi:FMN phosphatase YigB (HAD superfamily)
MTTGRGAILFDWGDTLMRDSTGFTSPMKDWPRVEAMPGAGEALAVLQPNWTLALATNADVSGEADIRLALRRVDLDQYLDRIYCFQGLGLRKPSPAFYRHILDDLALAPEQVFMVGDHFEADILGANALGIRAVWLNDKGEDKRSGDLYRTIQGLDELPDLIAGWN